MPYNQTFMLRKHMTFEEEEADDLAKQKVKKSSTSGLEDILERIMEEKKKN